MARESYVRAADTWGKGQSASREVREAEAVLERMVSEHIGMMSVVWLAVGDEPSAWSDRAYIEKNSIGLLAGKDGPIDIPSSAWLGNTTPHASIRNSGLWNVNYTDYTYDPRFLDVFAKYIEATLGRCPPPQKSIAPYDWYFADRGKYSRGQRSLFKEDCNE